MQADQVGTQTPPGAEHAHSLEQKTATLTPCRETLDVGHVFPSEPEENSEGALWIYDSSDLNCTP